MVVASLIQNGSCAKSVENQISVYKRDKNKALCERCDQAIDFSSMGESARKSHMKGTKHKNNAA